MNKRILIVIILMADVAFASPLQLEVRNVRNNTEIKAQKDDIKTLADAVSGCLHARGLDEDVASKKVFKCDYLRLNVSYKIYEIEAFFQKCFSMSFKTTGIIKFKYH